MGRRTRGGVTDRQDLPQRYNQAKGKGSVHKLLRFYMGSYATHFSDIGNNIDGTHQRIASLLLSQFLCMN